MSQITDLSDNHNGKNQPPRVEFCMGDKIIDHAYFEEHYENNISLHKETKDKLSLLRSCVVLLNDLEDTVHNRFAGRVLLFLAKVMPLFDQSGLNKLSEFSIKELPRNVVENLQRISNLTSQKDKLTSNGATQDMEEGETLSDDESNDSDQKDGTDRLYERFWKILQMLHQPHHLYDKTTSFTFRAYVDTVLTKFESTPATIQKKIRNSYMTEPKAFALQLEDVNMRRAFLVQLLIVLHHLEMPKAESRPENLVLDKVQLGWSARTVPRIFALLGSMPDIPEGREFLAFVKVLLRREEMWNKWKNDKCPEPKKIERDDEIINMRGTYHKKRKISDEMKSAKPYNMHVIGSQDMSRLWNLKPNQEFNQPDLMKYIDITEEKQAEKVKDPNYSFRVLRLLRKNSQFFEQTSAPIHSLDQYLKTTAGKILQQNRNQSVS